MVKKTKPDKSADKVTLIERVKALGVKAYEDTPEGGIKFVFWAPPQPEPDPFGEPKPRDQRRPSRVMTKDDGGDIP